MTPEPVSMWLQLDRASGTICNYLGIAKADYSPDDQAQLDKAVASYNEAQAFLFDWIYKTCGVK